MAAPKPQYDPHFTDQVIAATGPNANKRLAEIMPSLLRHLHDFAREVNLTVAELTAGVELVSLLLHINLKQQQEKKNSRACPCISSPGMRFVGWVRMMWRDAEAEKNSCYGCLLRWSEYARESPGVLLPA